MSGEPNRRSPVVRDALVLRVPRHDEEEEFLRAYYETSPDVPFFASYEPGTPFAEYLQRLTAQERGDGLRPGQVPSTFLFAFAGARIVGRVSIRHRLNEALERRGGHIGYVVVPEFRRRGFATAILSHSLRIARERHGIDRVLITCDADNVASIKTIERNGGVLEGAATRSRANSRSFGIGSTRQRSPLPRGGPTRVSFDLHAGPYYVVVDTALLSVIGGVVLALVAGTALWVTRRRRQ